MDTTKCLKLIYIRWVTFEYNCFTFRRGKPRMQLVRPKMSFENFAALEWGKLLTKHFKVILSPQKNKNISPIVMQNKTLSLADRDHFQNLLIDKLYDP